MKVTSLTALLCALPFASHATWFTETPLQLSYQSLLDEQPQLAWQELQIALNQEALDSQLWLPVKQEILTRTQCGRRLKQSDVPAHHIQVSFIKRYGLSSQGYQIKVSAEPRNDEFNEQAQTVSLIAPDGLTMIEGQLNSGVDYQEIETNEMFIKPESGVYQLTVGANSYPIVVAINDSKRWLTLENKLENAHVVVTPPEIIDNCPSTHVSWQWFDENYNMLGSKVPIKAKQVAVPTQSPAGEKAKHLSASVEMFEYQGAIEVQYVQRVAVPF
ncbi:DUF2861 family protein [Vibrio sp. ER1A]|uniref:DUF2861 family protein n=1 Tax=Vibrio sp. ER1A TaxID=1517681 RepID=UPI0004DD4083|nr:DUF2861 family protein [Vibrio sp. ER1A]KFA98696.1 hypothetical protein HW45_06595 [Vibrio sp. ER1A]